MRAEIKDADDIKLLVDRFYARVEQDELLAPIFHGKITDMQAHLETMYKFWQGILMNQSPSEHSTYDHGSLSKHEDLQLMNQHFVRWLSLFLDTIDDLYTGPTAELAKVRVIRMAEEFQNRLELLRF
ncbi:MAG TPA: group III truncated hemoglobin [Chryseosolibacter sp.]|nr:group III truncated hemoglobin [Chryseosolibacter sp.]